MITYVCSPLYIKIPASFLREWWMKFTGISLYTRKKFLYKFTFVNNRVCVYWKSIWEHDIILLPSLFSLSLSFSVSRQSISNAESKGYWWNQDVSRFKGSVCGWGESRLGIAPPEKESLVGWVLRAAYGARWVSFQPLGHQEFPRTYVFFVDAETNQSFDNRIVSVFNSINPFTRVHLDSFIFLYRKF